MRPPDRPYLYDMFVSYAHVDDFSPPNIPDGWVTTLVKYLRARVRARLGRSEKVEIWIDQRLRGNDEVVPEILYSLRNSATLLIVLSPGYIASRWCADELAAFLEAV